MPKMVNWFSPIIIHWISHRSVSWRCLLTFRDFWVGDAEHYVCTSYAAIQFYNFLQFTILETHTISQWCMYMYTCRSLGDTIKYVARAFLQSAYRPSALILIKLHRGPRKIARGAEGDTFTTLCWIEIKMVINPYFHLLFITWFQDKSLLLSWSTTTTTVCV